MWLLPLLLSGAALVIVLTRKTEVETPPTAEVPTASDILAAGNLPLLDYYYEVINAALFEGAISSDEYGQLYAAYEQRWWDLTGV